jgi:hypothetical protein
MHVNRNDRIGGCKKLEGGFDQFKQSTIAVKLSVSSVPSVVNLTYNHHPPTA